jgi:hypothetical protein
MRHLLTSGEAYMIDFRNFIGRGTVVGTPLDVYAQLLFFVKVGQGEFLDLGATQAAFKGKIDTVFYKGDLTLTLKMLEGGTAEINLNGNRSASATYTVSGQKLTFEAKLGSRSQVITFEQGGKGSVETFLGVTGNPSFNVHLAPGAKPAVG